MTMLPDVDQDTYASYQQDEFKRKAQEKIDSWSFLQAAQDKMNELHTAASNFTSTVGAAAEQANQPPLAQPPSAEAPAAPQGAATPDMQAQLQAAISAGAPSPQAAASPQAAPQPGAPSAASPDMLNQLQSTIAAGTSGLGDQLQQANQPPLAGASPDMLNQLQSTISAGTAGLGDQLQALNQAQPGRAITGQPQRGGDLHQYARDVAAQAGVDPDIFERQIQQESGFNPNAKSPVGASGIAQIVPQYHPGVDTSDPYASLDYAANLMKTNLARNGGDYSRALAAYNAGQGNVDKYGGVPPFEETNRYVNNILGGQNVQAPPDVGQLLARTGAAQQAAYKDISQFGDPQLSNDEAYSACGPAAAVRFAQRFGRNPTLREAVDLAKTVGWTEAGGMAGIASEQALMNKMGVDTTLIQGAQWDRIAQEAQTGNPVTISTQGHYFTADSYNPQTGQFHVGRSGSDLKGGSEWMTPDQMTSVMGPVQGALLANNPTVAAPSTANPPTSAGQQFTSATPSASPWDALMQQSNAAQERGRAWLDEQTRNLDQAVSGAARGAQDLNARTPGAEALSALAAPAAPTVAPPAPAAPTVNRLEPGAPGGPPSYTDFGRANAATAPQTSVWDRLGSGIADAFKSALGYTEALPNRPAPTVAGVPVQAPEALGGRAMANVTGDVLSGLGTGVNAARESPPAQWAGERWGAFTEGPAAGPLRGLDRRNLAEEQLRTEDPTYGSLTDQYYQLANDIASRPADLATGRRGTDEELDRLQQLRQARSDYTQQALNSWDAIDALARRNPNYEATEAQSGLAQSLAAGLIAPETLAGKLPLSSAAGAARLAAGVGLDPGQAPFLAFQGATEVPELLRGAERLGGMSNLVADGEDVVSKVRKATGAIQTAPLEDNIAGDVADAVRAAIGKDLTPEEIADAQRTLDEAPSKYGKAALNPFEMAQTPEGLARIRNQLRALADMGKEQRFWYDDSSQKIMEAAQGDKTEAEKIAQLVAIYSNRTPVNDNMNRALMAWTQFKQGVPIDVPGMSGPNERARQLLEGGLDWEGAKTNNFYRNLMKNIDNEKYLEMGRESGETGSTIDFWMMRAMNSLRNSPSPKTGQYEFAADEVGRIAKELGWTPEQAQAAIWVAAKAGWENPGAKFATRKVPMDLSAAGTYHYGTALAERLGQMGGAAADQIRNLVQDESGVDTVARDLGLLGADGKIFLAKARASREGVELPEAIGMVDAASRQAMNVYTAGIAKALKLPEASWARMFDARKLDEANGLAVTADRALSADEIAQLQDHLDALTGPGVGKVIPTEDGAWIINRSDSPNKAFHVAGRKALNALESDATVSETPARFDGEFFSNDWSNQPNGEGYLDSIRQSGGSAAAKWQEIESGLAGRLSDAGAGGPGDLAAEAARLFQGPRAGIVADQGAQPLRSTLAQQAAYGALASGSTAAQQPGATPQDVATAALGGAALGAGRAGVSRALGLPLGLGALGRVARVAEEVKGAAGEAGRYGLNFDKYKFQPEEIQQVIQDAYDRMPDAMDAARRGVIPDDVVREMADQIDPKRLRAMINFWNPGDAKNAETIYAMRQAMADSGARVVEAQKALRDAPTSLDARMEMLKAMTRHQAVQEAVTGVTAEAGRAVRQFREPVEGTNLLLDRLTKMAQAKGMGAEELVNHLSNVDLSDPKTLGNLARELNPASKMDKLMALWYFNMLSSPVTHMRNVIGNSVAAASVTPEAAGAAAADPLARLMIRAIGGKTAGRERFFGEALAQPLGQLAGLDPKLADMVGLEGGLGGGVRNALDAMLHGPSAEEIIAERAHPEAWAGTPLAGVHIPGRALEAEDLFFRALNQQGAAYRMAYRQAMQEGVRGAGDVRDRMLEIMRNPTEDFLKQLKEEGKYRTFQQDTTVSNALLRLRHDLPATRFLMPFARTPVNMMQYTLERSPLGAAKILADFATPAGREALRTKGAGDLAERISRAALGSAVFGGLTAWSGDNLTGRAPDDPTERDAFYRQGKQPYSFRSPLDSKWYSYQSLQPFTPLISAAANVRQQLNDPRKSKDVAGLAALAAFTAGQSMLDMPWTQGLMDAMDVMSGQGAKGRDPMGMLNDYAERQATSITPASALMGILARAQDNTIRDPQNPLEAMMARVPFLQERVQPRLNAFGEPRRGPTSGLEVLNPFNPSTATEDPVEKALAELDLRDYNVQPGLVGKSISVAGQPVDLRNEQQQDYQRQVGQLTYSMLQVLVGSDEWKTSSNADKAKAVDLVESRVRDAVRTEMTPELWDQAVQALVDDMHRKGEDNPENVLPPAEATPTSTGPIVGGGGAVVGGATPVRGGAVVGSSTPVVTRRS